MVCLETALMLESLSRFFLFFFFSWRATLQLVCSWITPVLLTPVLFSRARMLLCNRVSGARVRLEATGCTSLGGPVQRAAEAAAGPQGLARCSRRDARGKRR